MSDKFRILSLKVGKNAHMLLKSTVLTEKVGNLSKSNRKLETESSVEAMSKNIFNYLCTFEIDPTLILSIQWKPTVTSLDAIYFSTFKRVSPKP